MSVKLIAVLILILTASAPADASFRRRLPENRYYHYLMGRYYLNTGQPLLAQDHLETALLMDPSNLTVTEELLEIYYISGQYRKAFSMASRMYGFYPEDPDLLEIYADILFKTGKDDRAVEILQKLVELEPGRFSARSDLAGHYEMKEDFSAALKQYYEILKRDKSNLYAVLAIADVYMLTGNTRAAVRHYLEGIKMGADQGEIYRQIARIYNQQGSTRKAVRYLERAVRSVPDDWQSLMLAAEFHKEAGDFKRAGSALERLVENFPDIYGVLLQSGIIYAEMEALEEAAQVFTRVTSLFPEEHAGWHFLGLLKEYAGEYSSALEALSRALEIKRTDRGYFHLGIVYDKLDMREESYEAFKKCIELNPDHAAAKNYLGYSWAERGIRLDEAKQLILEALEIEPGNAAFIDSLGWVYFQQERYEEALEELKKAASKLPDPIILEHLGDTYLKLGELSSAVASYKQALEGDPENKELINKLESLKE